MSKQADARMKFPVTLTPDEDGGCVVECPVLPGCISQGETRDEAGALWTRAMIEATVASGPGAAGFQARQRVVVGIDPALTAGETSDMTGSWRPERAAIATVAAACVSVRGSGC